MMEEFPMGDEGVGGERLDLNKSETDSFGAAMDEYKDVSFEAFRSKVDNENDNQDESTEPIEFDLTPLEKPGSDGLYSESSEPLEFGSDSDDSLSGFDLTPLDSDENLLGYAEPADGENESEGQSADFDLTPLEPVSDRALIGPNDETIDNDASTPSVSSMSGALLEPTDTEGIMTNGYDGLLYKVISDGKAIPLKSPLNGSPLELTETEGIMHSEYDGLLYKVTSDGAIIPLESPIDGAGLRVVGENVFEDKTTGQRFSLGDDLELKLNG